MNKRILELAEQAGMTDDKYGMFFAKRDHNENGVDLETFAHLIIRECVQVGGPEDSFRDEWFIAKTDCVNKILQNFEIQ